MEPFLFAGRSLWLDFGITPKRRDATRLSPGNSELLKLVMLYYMYGERSMLSPESLRFVITSVRPIFKLCTDNGILVSQLRRFPLVLSQIPAVLAQSKVPAVMTILYELYNARELLGFEMADVGEIQKLLKSATSVERSRIPTFQRDFGFIRSAAAERCFRISFLTGWNSRRCSSIA